MGRKPINKKIAVGVPAILSVAMYVASHIFADILSTKIAILPLIGLAVDGGTIIYPLTFTIRDFVHMTLGKHYTKVVVWATAGLNIVMVALFWIIAIIPQEPSWGLQMEYEAILLPVARITIASILAEIVSQLVDTEVFSKVFKWWGEKRLVSAVLLSNLVGLIFDSILFGFLAFFGALPFNIVIEIIIANILIKGAMTLLSAPIIKLIPLTAPKELM